MTEHEIKTIMGVIEMQARSIQALTEATAKLIKQVDDLSNPPVTTVFSGGHKWWGQPQHEERREGRPENFKNDGQISTLEWQRRISEALLKASNFGSHHPLSLTKCLEMIHQLRIGIAGGVMPPVYLCDHKIEEMPDRGH